MINTFLFDLDGTLLPLDWDIFEKAYFGKLASKFIDHFEPDYLIKSIWKSTIKTIKNTEGDKTNKEIFFEDFIKNTGEDIDVLSPIFDEFYLNEFDELKCTTSSEDYVIKTVELLKMRGYEMVIATNPIFPLEAIRKRISWAGLNEDWFKYITCYENMHYCKPNVEFYRELLSKIDKSPKECIMVGNDVEEDMVASELGIKTFLVEDYLIHSKDEEIRVDFKGKYQDLYNTVRDGFLSVNGTTTNKFSLL